MNNSTTTDGLAFLFCFFLLQSSFLSVSSISDGLKFPLDPKLPRAQAEKLIRDLNLLPKEASAHSLDGIADVGEKRIVERRFRFPGLQGLRNEGLGDVLVDDLGHHAGYYRLPHTYDSRWRRFAMLPSDFKMMRDFAVLLVFFFS